MYMGISRILKPFVFVYECIKVLALTLVFILLNSNTFIAPWLSPMVIYIAPMALFPIMALFIWLNTARYRAYLPLLAAGKAVGLFIILGWSIISRQGTMMYMAQGAFNFLDMMVCGDLLTLAAVFVIIREYRKIDAADMEEK